MTPPTRPPALAAILEPDLGWSLAAPAEEFAVPRDEFRAGRWLSADFYNPHAVILQIKLGFVAGATGRAGAVIFGLYPQVRARLRIPASALAQNAWLLPREGALLKPMCGGDIVRPEEVSALRMTVLAGPEGDRGYWRTPFVFSEMEPARLARAASPHRVLIDALGQFAPKTWPDKTHDEAELVRRLRAELASADTERFPAHWTRWGGSAALPRFEATGWFRTRHDGRRWWLVDPDGAPFWSTGPCCVSPLVEAATGGLGHLLEWLPPEDDPAWAAARIRRDRGAFAGDAVNFLAANLIRAFGPADWRSAWSRLAAAALRRQRFNTIANWSDLALGREHGIPYTRPLRDIDSISVPKIFRDFPDVFDAGFVAGCAAWAEQLRGTRDDPAFIGYFLCNEPTWAIAANTPAAGMLANTEEAASRAEFAAWLRARHGDDASLARAWGAPEATFARVARGRWPELPAANGFRADAEAFSSLLVSRLFETLSAACRAVDPHHLNLGARFAHLPPDWMLPGLGVFDVFSFNSYSKRARPAAAEIAKRLRLPVLIGEWHFGATDTGFPAAALETVATQADRALAYQRYLESHAAEPWCVGAHWFTLYDQSALGRYDGEPYNCGFYDVCHREQTEIAAAARASHERLYAIAAGQLPPTELPAPRHTLRLSL